MGMHRYEFYLIFGVIFENLITCKQQWLICGRYQLPSDGEWPLSRDGAFWHHSFWLRPSCIPIEDACLVSQTYFSMNFRTKD